MSPITADFQSDLPLHPKAAELLLTFFDRGWHDPNKLHHEAAQLRILINEAKEEIAGNLGCHASELEFVGELGFGFWTALSGLFEDKDISTCQFLHSSIDRQVVHAFARRHRDRGGLVYETPVDANGSLDFSVAPRSSAQRVISWQATNRETGVIQSHPRIEESDDLFADMTAALPGSALPQGWSVALWDPQRFAGPQGIAILAISRSSRWKNPLPPMDNKRTFGSFSKPLLLATAVSLSSYLADFVEAKQRIESSHQLLRRLLRERLPDIRMIDDDVKADSRYLALGIPDLIGEELVRQMDQQNFRIDAGSACGSGPLSPSHVFDAMGWNGLAHIRLTLKSDQNNEQITGLVDALEASVRKLRA